MKKWKNASFPIHTAIFLDLLSLIRRLSITFQPEEYNLVKAVQQIEEFNWTMDELKILTESSLEGQNTRLTHYKQFLGKIDARNDGRFYYQDVKLSKYTDTENTVSTFYGDCITRILENVERRFENLLTLPVLSNLVSLLGTSIWPSDDENLATFGENQILERIKHFNVILLSNSCDIYQVQTEWDRLKNHLYILENNLRTTNLNIWGKKITNSTIFEECKIVLRILEILLVTPFTNARVGRVFSRMNRTKTDWRNRLGQITFMIISKEGPVEEFNPDHAINAWYSKKMRRLGGETSHKYQANRARTNTGAIDLARATLSDLENNTDSDDN